MSTSHVHSDVAPIEVTVVSPPDIPQEVRDAAKRLGVGQYFDEVAAFTVEIFGSFNSVELVPDPEVPDWEHIIFAVPVRGEADRILETGKRWSKRLRETIPRAPRVYSYVMDYEE